MALSRWLGSTRVGGLAGRRAGGGPGRYTGRRVRKSVGQRLSKSANRPAGGSASRRGGRTVDRRAGWPVSRQLGGPTGRRVGVPAGRRAGDALGPDRELPHEVLPAKSITAALDLAHPQLSRWDTRTKLALTPPFSTMAGRKDGATCPMRLRPVVVSDDLRRMRWTVRRVGARPQTSGRVRVFVPPLTWIRRNPAAGGG